MATLISRLRGTIAAEVDDYFTDETLLFYLNGAKSRVFSTLVSLEQRGSKTLRALDNLKHEHEITTTGVTTEEIETGIFKFDLTFPTLDHETEQYLYVEYKDTPLRELNQQDLIKLRNSNIVPTQTESYYNIKFTDDLIFTVYLFEEPTEAIKLYAIERVDDLTDLSEDLGELPNRFINPVIYSAAAMATMQESIKDPDGTASPQLYEQMYDKEMQTAIY
jgi:hypothetical protein